MNDGERQTTVKSEPNLCDAAAYFRPALTGDSML